MKELRDILKAAQKVKESGETAALATIVKAKGSTYRRAGARMLMTRAGDMVGSMSGGCLEGDVFEHAKKVMQSGVPVVAEYDTSSDDDAVWGLGLGCSGVVHVMIEPLQPEPEYMPFLTECVEQERAGVLATVFRIEGNAHARIGSRWMLGEDGRSSGLLEAPELSAALLHDAEEALNTGRSTTGEYQLATGRAEVFVESIQPAIPLVLFGAGHDAIPVVRLAKDLGWNVTVLDSRPAFATTERFPQADKVILSTPEEMRTKLRLDRHTVAVIMTHNYDHDLNLLRALLSSPARYLGVLGPRKRTEMLLDDLRKEGVAPTEQQLARLYSPVGIDLGAETSEEIALAIVGEIQTVLSGRSAGLLRNRKGPIHSRNAE